MRLAAWLLLLLLFLLPLRLLFAQDTRLNMTVLKEDDVLPPPPDALPLGDVGNAPKETETTANTGEERAVKNATDYFQQYPPHNVSPFPPPGYYLNPPPGWEGDSENPPKANPCPYPGAMHNPPFGYPLPPWPIEMASPYYSHPNSDRSSCKIVPPCFGRWPPKDPYEGEPPPFGLYQVRARPPRYRPPLELYDLQQECEESEAEDSTEVSTQDKGDTAPEEVSKKQEDSTEEKEKSVSREEATPRQGCSAEEQVSEDSAKNTTLVKAEGATRQSIAAAGYVYKPRPGRPEVFDDPAARREKKNAQARERAERNRKRLIEIEAKPENERTASEREFMAVIMAKRARKNNRSRNRAAENKAKLDFILAIPVEQRTKDQADFVVKMLKIKKRKNEGDCERRRRIKLEMVGGDY